MDSTLIPLIVLLIGVLVLGVLGAVIVYNFIRFRFENDRTITIMLTFAIAILVVIIGTIALLQVPRATEPQVERSSGQFF